MGKDMMSKIRAGDVWKAMARVLDEFRIEKEDFHVLDRRPHPQLTVRYCGQERMMSFPCTPRGHGRAPYKYSTRLRRMLQEMEIAGAGDHALQGTVAMDNQANLPLFQSVSSAAVSVPVFSFEGRAVRVVIRDDAPWFVLADVCVVLGISNSGNASARLDDDEKGIHTMDTPGGSQKLVIINESGLYSLTLSSRKDEAKRFKKWITSEVLPSIRRTGGYGTAPVPDYSDPRVLLGVLTDLQEKVAIRDGVIAVQGKRLETLDRIEGADGSMCITDAAKTLNKRPRDLTAFLSSRRWIYKRPGNKNWIAFQEKIQAGYLEHDEYLYTDSQDRERASTRVLVTQKGLVALAKLLDEPLH